MNVKQFLDEHNIIYSVHTHPPVYTCEEAEQYPVPGLACKNLLLADDSGKKYLVIIPAEKKMDFKRFAALVSAKKVTFAGKDLFKRLGIDDGAVSLFCMFNDTQKELSLYIDKDVYDADIVSFHPNINTETLEFSREMFHTVLDVLGCTCILF
ncbi:MAG: YbaK/EbsC family protein [archaeon]